MKIEIVRDTRPFYMDKSPLVGRKAIMVDGKLWGEARMEAHGRNGSSWFFHQCDHKGEIIRERIGRARVGYKAQFEVFSHRIPGRPDTGTADTFDGRMVEVAREMIRLKLLRDPAVVKREADRALAKRREASRRAREREENKFRERAAACISGINFDEVHADSREECVGKIVEAMRWAQTR